MRSLSLHRRKSALGAVGIAAAIATVMVGASSRASAQTAPDIRNIRPVVMLLVDTSGSMEYETGEATGVLPTCSGSASGANDRSRWATVLEALTGGFQNFYCTAQPRSSFPGAPDQFYALPYHRPGFSEQIADGVLDSYAERVKFGLMTYDAYFGLTTVHEVMVPQTTFMANLAANASAAGDFSYGEVRPLTFPGCTTTFMVDGGARNASAPYGALVSVGTDTDSSSVINQTIQSQLLGIRPYGGTPTAALLYDFQHYLANHPDVASATTSAGDPYAACRHRYAILLTDGQPSDPFSALGCNTPGFTCPYPDPSDIARDLCQAGADGCTGDIDGLFVVGFEIDDVAAQARLHDLALQGGTGSALMATNRESLLTALSTALNRAAPGTTTRTAPTFATSSSGTTSGSGPQAAFRFNSGFRVPTEAGEPWSGVLDRTRIVCDASDVPQPQTLDPDRDSFHQILNERNLSSSPRRLLTVATPRAAEMTGIILGEGDSLAPLGGGGGGGGGGPTGPAPTTVTDQTLTEFDSGNSALTPAHFGLSGGSATTLQEQRAAIIDWVHGRAGTARDGNRFGDIYHSTPVVVGPPRSDIADESYNLFRRRADVATRPTVVYVGTNDGILHAFAAEDINVTTSTGTRRIAAGEEIWGFVPPAIVPRLLSATVSRQILLDGTPVVKDVFFMRTPGQLPTDDPSSPASYRTVLVMGLRGGDNSYFALDVSDPLSPKFLWQFTDRYMGATFARPAIGQVLLRVGGQLQERAVALLPGGRGDLDLDAVRTTGPVGCPAQGVGQPPVNEGTENARSRQRCWGRTGRDLHWVDVVTGETIFSFDHRTFNAPITGGISLFTGDTGTIATRAFLTDDDGIVWRIDFSSANTSEWRATPFHDIFWDADATVGQPAFEPPILTTNTAGEVVIIQATGDVDALDSTAQNRVVSLTEHLNAATGAVTGELNWEIRLRPGELVTGPLDLYDGQVFFGSFESTSSTDACNYGQSRIWAVEYLRGGGSPPSGYTARVTDRYPLPRLETTEGSGELAHFIGPYLNQIVMGVQVTQQITCSTGEDVFDPYVGQRYRVNSTGGGAFQLSAQISGGGGAPTAGASSVRTFTRTLPAPAAYTRIYSWVPQADQ